MLKPKVEVAIDVAVSKVDVAEPVAVAPKVEVAVVSVSEGPIARITYFMQSSIALSQISQFFSPKRAMRARPLRAATNREIVLTSPVVQPPGERNRL